MDWLELLFTPIRPFVTHPERIMAVAAILLALFLGLGLNRRRWSWPLLWATGLWIAFAIWEWMVREADIRVDLLVIYPVLLVATLWSLWAGLYPTRRPKPRR